MSKNKFLYALNGSGCYACTRKFGRKIMRRYPGVYTWDKKKVKRVPNVHYDEGS